MKETETAGGAGVGGGGADSGGRFFGLPRTFLGAAVFSRGCKITGVVLVACPSVEVVAGRDHVLY